MKLPIEARLKAKAQVKDAGRLVAPVKKSPKKKPVKKDGEGQA